MASKLKLISELAAQTSREIARDKEGWKRYLTTASRLYKYPFDEQILIYAQRPDATACASMELWNQDMNRWVKAGSKGIAVMRDNGSGRPRLEYVFDMADTKPVRGAKTPYLWNLKTEHHGAVLAALESRYGETQGVSMGGRLMEIAARAVKENYQNYFESLRDHADGSLLEGLDAQNMEIRFRNVLTASVQFALLSRCGIEPSAYLDEDELRGITEFSTYATLYHLGNAVSAVSMDLLQEIGRSIRNYDRGVFQEQQKKVEKDLAKSIKMVYSKGTENLMI